MRTNEERILQIHQRTAELHRIQQQKKQYRQASLGIAVCLLLLLHFGMQLPQWIPAVDSNPIQHASGAASLIANHTALGYILMGIFSFFLGVSFTVLLYRLRLHSEAKAHTEEDEDHEF